VSALDVVVLLGGGTLVGWELWYFLAPRRRERPLPTAGAQEIQVRVRDGFEPDVIPVEAGRPVRLVFFRDESVQCSGELIFETLDLRRALPAFERTVIEFTPDTPGDYPFRCGHTDLRGRVVAQVATPPDPRRGHHEHA
jgi:P-type Cu+ transporter